MISDNRMERKAREKAEYMRRVARNPFYRLACIVGLMYKGTATEGTV